MDARTDLILSHQRYNVLWHHNNNACAKYYGDNGSGGKTDWVPCLYTTDFASSCIFQFLTQSSWINLLANTAERSFICSIVVAISSITCSQLILSLKASYPDDVKGPEVSQTQLEHIPLHSRWIRTPPVTVNHSCSSASRNLPLPPHRPDLSTTFSKNNR